MDILFITWNYPPRRGGIENLMHQLSAGLAKKHSVFVVTAHVANPPAGEDRVFRAPWPGLISFGFYALWRGAMALIRNRDIGVVFGGSAMVAPLVFILARVFRRKAVVQAHGLDIAYASVIYQILCVRWLRYCDGMVANSNYTATLAAERGVPRELIYVIPLGVDAGRFSPAANREKLKEEIGLEGKSVILFVGRLARRKGVKEFIQNCLPLIVRKIPQACFVIAGGNPTDSLTHRDDVLSELQEAALHLGLGDHTRFVGEVSENALVKLYQCCDVMVLPALASAEDVEGFGLVLLEAAAAGKPVVATRVGGIPDAVEDGITGLLVEEGEYFNLAEAVIKYLNDDELSRQAGEKGQKRARRQFGWETVTARYEELFLKLLI